MGKKKILVAKLKDKNLNLNKVAHRVNRGRTDDVNFYASAGSVFVSIYWCDMSLERQRKELEWFLEGKEYEFVIQ